MGEDEIDYDTWLETYQPSERALQAGLPENTSDPWVLANLLDDQTGTAGVARTPYAPGIKAMSADELEARNFDFFVEHQARWSEEFRDRALGMGVPATKLDKFVEGFASDWVDGFSRRQNSPFMRSIKASIRDHDHSVYPSTAEKWTLKPVSKADAAFFTVAEMAAIFAANETLSDMVLTDYVETLDSSWASTTSDIFVRRGVHLLDIPEYRHEKYELSSWSLGLGAVEQFAIQYTPQTEGVGTAAIFSAPFPAVQGRIVAFAPFIPEMTLGQLELVLAPPVQLTALQRRGHFGGIQELAFD